MQWAQAWAWCVCVGEIFEMGLSMEMGMGLGMCMGVGTCVSMSESMSVCKPRFTERPAIAPAAGLPEM